MITFIPHPTTVKMCTLTFMIALTLGLANSVLAQGDAAVLASMTAPGQVAAPATTNECLATWQDPFGCGSCGMSTISVTQTVDCHGCSSLTTTTIDPEVAICMCPTEAATRTYSVCS